jgi:hypothetical protein
MPLTVFDVRGITGNRRERIEAAVVAGGKHGKRWNYQYTETNDEATTD